MTDLQLPPRLQAIVADFELCEGKEKLELLLEYSNKMPPLPERLAQNRGQLEQVHECMTPVFVHAEMKDGGMEFYFDVPAESPSVRGYAALLSEGVNSCVPNEILAIPGDFYLAMGLQEVLSGQRLNGMRAILAYIKRLAGRELAGDQE
ncbi:MAG TPA: SufE family protein [Anaerolineales bacterium]|nr:SufE family protein [Anaerolineales bacterium]